ncbi:MULTISPECIES: ABC transporter substrate-binding protein [unclassified Frankia]
MKRPRSRFHPAVRVAAVAAAAMLGACASDPAPVGSTSANGAGGTPHRGGTLTFAVATEGDCLDPHVSPADVTAVIQRGVFDSLVAQQPSGGVGPWLATSWTVSADAKTFTFKLKDGVTFHDGTPFDAAAVKANFDHIAAKSTKSQYAVALLGPYVGTEVVDPRTAKVTFSKPYAAFLAAAATAYLGIESPKKIAEAPDTLCSGGPNSVGTGPFRFTRYVKGSVAEFTRNDGYTSAPGGAKHTGAAYLDKLAIRFLPEDATRVSALRSGEIDAADGVPAQNVAALEGDNSLRLLKVIPQNANYSIHFNTRRAPFSDERVRKAVQRAVDVDTIVKTVYAGQYARAWSTLTPKNIAYDPSLEKAFPHDVAAANKLLDEAGYTGRDADGYRTKNGARLVLDWPYVGAFNREQRDIVSQAVQADLKKAGIATKLYSMDSGAYTTQRNAGGYDLIAYSWGKSDPDLLRTLFASNLTFTQGGANSSGIAVPEVDEWLATSAGTTDLAARKKAYGQVQKYVIDHAYTLPVYVFTRTVGTASKVHDITFDADAFPLFYDSWVG